MTGDSCRAFGPREDGLAEFSVVYTERALNHMSEEFREVMRDLSDGLRSVYNARGVAIVPGGGTAAMEAVARQFARCHPLLVIRNGWFSYRWSQIVEAGALTEGWHTVMKARRVGNGPHAPFAPAPIEEVVARIREERPEVIAAPHVETSSGILLPDDYIRALAEAAREVDALLVLDCIASGCLWVDMEALGVDVLVSAPQKGWSSTPSAGLVMLGERAETRLAETFSDSFMLDLARWREIMRAYEAGGHAYHATMPTDALRAFRDTMKEMEAMGFDRLETAQRELGRRVRSMLEAHGFPSVAAEGWKAPGVVVSYTDDPEIQSGARFAAQGVQVAAGVPLACDEGEAFRTFRIGLFGIDKLTDIDATVARLEGAVERVLAAS